ncbi:hypothetical protein [Citrobacter braakii]|uniref:hypothetical protein n=1 Tax=Citrobacter braakii TaxID=57706 RepID=UPI00397B39D0
MFIQFFLPYLTLCNLASWGLAQNLEGLGIFQYLNSQPIQIGDNVVYPLNLNPVIGVTSLSITLTGILIVVFVLNVRACFYLNKWVGGIGLLLWFLPGLLNLFGFLPDIRSMGPDIFRFGDGFPGSMKSAAANLLICLVSGWSIILLISSFWKKNTFKNFYDHIWYILGLIAALYFVVDAGLPSYKADLSEADDRMVRTLKLFRAGEERLEILCPLPEVAALSPSLCALTPELRWNIPRYLDLNSTFRVKSESPNWTAKLTSEPTLAIEIEKLNIWTCTHPSHKSLCQTVPTDTAMSIKDIDKPIAFPPPSYALSIQALHASMQKADQRISEIERGHNTRYFVFLILAFMAGGKLANASRSMVKDDSVLPPSWILQSIKCLGYITIYSFKEIVMLLTLISRLLAQKAVVINVHWKKFRLARSEQKKETVYEQE